MNGITIVPGNAINNTTAGESKATMPRKNCGCNKLEDIRTRSEKKADFLNTLMIIATILIIISTLRTLGK